MATLAVTPLIPVDQPARVPVVALLDAEPELGAGLTPDELAAARPRVLAPLLTIGPGTWEPGGEGEGGRFAFLLVEGLLRRELTLGGRRATELLGPGDVVDPYAPSDGLVPLELAWVTDEPTTLAVLDARFIAAARRWPALGIALHRRLATQAARTSVHLAIAQLGRVDLRVLALLWHLAERWGVVAPDGVVVSLRLTHAALGRLVGAQRPTVTLALQQLADSGDLTRRPDGAFVLRPGSLDGAPTPAGEELVRAPAQALEVARASRPRDLAF